MRLFLETVFVFISTEIDDFLVFVVLFASHKNLKSRALLFSGRFFAVVLTAVLSAFASSLLSKIPHFYLRFFGLVPLFIGVFRIFSIFKKDDDDDKDFCKNRENLSKRDFAAAISLFFSAFLLTLASSGDNAGIYIPFFLNFDFSEKILVILEIAFLNFLWTLFQAKSASLPFVEKIVRKTGKILVPAVFILLGISVLVDF